MCNFEITGKSKLSVIIDPAADSGIRKIWKKVEKDIYHVTKASCTEGKPGEKISSAILVATLGCGKLPEALIKRVPELGTLEGKWESYGFYVVKEPLEGIDEGVIILGSDKLGTIYGMFHLSELLGVSAWEFWGDVKPPQYDQIVLQAKNVNGCSKEPSVKFRGFFINDEWPCFGTWTKFHFGGINAEVYEHVFEYLLRMKGNYLWPAMWASNFLLDGPGLASMELATEYGIYIGMSHHEPCMRSGAEYSLFRGKDSIYGDAWDYAANEAGILKFWEDGLTRVKGQTIFPTVGMRGENDSKLLGENATIEENAGLLKKIIKNQRKLLAQHINPDLNQIPQLFAIYKEVEDYYYGSEDMDGVRGYEEIEDVTLLFCEDNFGNMRALPQGEERAHCGGFGMYYHLDYHGSPISYEWVTSTPLSKVWEQMTEAYEYGVRNLWIVNVGDIKFNEYPLGYFMELAYDFEKWGSGHQDRIREYSREWARRQFGCYVSDEELEEIVWVQDEYIRLNALRRPEANNASVYHYAHYNEGRRMFERVRELERRNERLMDQLRFTPAGDGYYSMIYFSAAASANLLKMYLLAGMNDRCATQGKAIANVYGGKLSSCISRDRILSRDIGDFKDGKWKGMEKAFHIGFVNWNSEDWRYPIRHMVTLPADPRLVVSRIDGTKVFTNQYFPITLEFNDFLSVEDEFVTIQIANGGNGVLRWEIPERCEFLEFSAYRGETEMADEIKVWVHKENLPVGEIQEFHCQIRTATEFVPVVFRVLNQDLSAVPSGAFVERNGRCVLDAVDYQKKEEGIYEGESAGFQMIPDYGKFESGLKVFPTIAEFTKKDWREGTAPYLDYEVWVFHPGRYVLQLHTSPANPLHYGGTLNYGVSVNFEPVETVSMIGENYKGGDGNCQEWCRAVLDQEHVAEYSICMVEGLNHIRIYAGDAGIVLERLTLYLEEKPLRDSYLGPQKSFRMV